MFTKRNSFDSSPNVQLAQETINPVHSSALLILILYLAYRLYSIRDLISISYRLDLNCCLTQYRRQLLGQAGAQPGHDGLEMGHTLHGSIYTHI